LQATKLIGSTEALFDDDAGIMDGNKDAREEATKRVLKAQSLIGKFLSESGVEDEQITAFVAKHPAE